MHLSTVETLLRADGNSLKNIGEMCLATDEFVCGYNGIDPGNLLEILRAAAITEKMPLDEEILEKRDTPPQDAFFCSRNYLHWGLERSVWLLNKKGRPCFDRGGLL